MNTTFDLEVEDDLRQEKIKRWWGEYGGIIIAVVVAAILGVSGRAGWDTWQQTQEREKTRRLVEITALQAEQGIVAEASISQFLDDYPDLSGVIAALHAARTAYNDGQEDTALSLYRDVAARDSIFRDYATLMVLLIDFDSLSIAEIRETIAPYIATESPWTPLAEMLAALVALEENDTEAAIVHLTGIVTRDGVSNALRKQAETVLRQVSTAPTQDDMSVEAP